MNKKICLILTVLLCLTVAFAACGGNQSATSDEALPEVTTYKVTVSDVLGNGYASGIIVRFMQNGEQIAMQACDENGVATAELKTGEYTISLSFTEGEEGYYYEAPAALTPQAPEIVVNLSKKISEKGQQLFVSTEEFSALPIETGCYYVTLNAGKMNYFLFSPSVAGNYEFSVYNNADAKIGYYGAPHYVQTQSAVEVKEDNSFTISVSASMIGSGDSGTTVLVIGVEATNNTENCILCIDRIGDPIKTIEDEPWNIYKTTASLSEYTLPEGYEIKEFDLTAPTDTYNLVYNESDGFYHLDTADGPLVLVRLAEDCDYIACFKTILDRSGVSRYFYDEDGNFEKKVSYSECLLEYIDYAEDEEGVYPLTEDLKHIIQNRGEYVGWWDSTSNGYIFKDDNGNNDLTINSEIAWLLMCCYLG